MFVLEYLVTSNICKTLDERVENMPQKFSQPLHRNIWAKDGSKNVLYSPIKFVVSQHKTNCNCWADSDWWLLCLFSCSLFSRNHFFRFYCGVGLFCREQHLLVSIFTHNVHHQSFCIPTSQHGIALYFHLFTVLHLFLRWKTNTWISN